MAFHSLKLLRVLQNQRVMSLRGVSGNITRFTTQIETRKRKEVKEEDDLKYYGDPDTFGTLSRRTFEKDLPDDDEDIKEENFLRNKPLPSQQLTIKQYADIIKQYLNHKRLKEAIDVLEVRMLKEDRVKPENYIYNILIGACAEVGYTKKAFKLFNDMKKRALKPTGDTYTCLFNACANSPWAADGLKNAHHLHELMTEKLYEPNLTNYNAMIKAFGRCGDLPTAFQIVDEMIAKNIKIRNHTFNHLLQACISDKENGLRHALIVWRKMLAMKEKPNIYSFNLMLRCVKDCNMGSKKDIQELIGVIQENLVITQRKTAVVIEGKQLALPSKQSTADNIEYNGTELNKSNELIKGTTDQSRNEELNNVKQNELPIDKNTNQDDVRILEFTNKLTKPKVEIRQPNLLSKVPTMSEVLSLQKVTTMQERFAVIGGQEDFLNEMAVYSVKPDIKTFTQMLAVLDDTEAAELQLLESMKSAQVLADIDFYNMLIKKRCFRKDYEGANKVLTMIKEENQARRKKHPAKGKLIMKPNIMTYGVLAMACDTKEQCVTFLDDMKGKQLKINIEILGTLLRHATFKCNFSHIIHLLKIVKEENLNVNEVFLKHLEAFNDKCVHLLQEDEKGRRIVQNNSFTHSFSGYMIFYKAWLKDVNAEAGLKQNHPWEQFKENYPETVQRQNLNIKIPKKFYKRNRKYVRFSVKV